MSHLASLTSSTTKSQKRIGRGYGSGKGGHTSTRGQKGQKSRSGSKIPLWFEGGQLPLIKRLPMWRGKNRLNGLTRTAVVSLSQLNTIDTTEITPETLRLYKLVPARTVVCKVVATGAVTKKVHLSGIQVSATARQAIESAGGSVTEV